MFLGFWRGFISGFWKDVIWYDGRGFIEVLGGSARFFWGFCGHFSECLRENFGSISVGFGEYIGGDLGAVFLGFEGRFLCLLVGMLLRLRGLGV